MIKKLFSRKNRREQLLKRLKNLRKFDELEASLDLLGLLKLKGIVF